MIVYYSQNCANSQRLLSILGRIPSLQRRVQMKDVHSLSPSERAGLQYVPTIVDDQGRQHVGSKAFEFMKQFDEEMELESAPPSFGRLAFSDLEGFGESQYTTAFGDFDTGT